MQNNQNPQKKAKNNPTMFLWGVAVIVAIISIATVLFPKNVDLISTKESSTNDAGGIVIPVDNITEKASFISYDKLGTKMEVIAVKASDGTIRTAFNTCQVCYSSGRGYYKQEGNVLVCQNCGNRFKMDQVGITKGGCNPVPITNDEETITETSITISNDFLKQSESIFANWKV